LIFSLFLLNVLLSAVCLPPSRFSPLSCVRLGPSLMDVRDGHLCISCVLQHRNSAGQFSMKNLFLLHFLLLTEEHPQAKWVEIAFVNVRSPRRCIRHFLSSTVSVDDFFPSFLNFFIGFGTNLVAGKNGRETPTLVFAIAPAIKRGRFIYFKHCNPPRRCLRSRRSLTCRPLRSATPASWVLATHQVRELCPGDGAS